MSLVLAISTLHIHNAAITTIITRDLLPSVRPRSAVGRAAVDEEEEVGGRSSEVVGSILAEFEEFFLSFV